MPLEQIPDDASIYKKLGEVAEAVEPYVCSVMLQSKEKTRFATGFWIELPNRQIVCVTADHVVEEAEKGSMDIYATFVLADQTRRQLATKLKVHSRSDNDIAILMPPDGHRVAVLDYLPYSYLKKPASTLTAVTIHGYPEEGIKNYGTGAERHAVTVGLTLSGATGTRKFWLNTDGFRTTGSPDADLSGMSGSPCFGATASNGKSEHGIIGVFVAGKTGKVYEGAILIPHLREDGTFNNPKAW